MKTTKIYKGLIFKENTMILNGVELFSMPNPENSMDSFLLDTSVYELKRDLRNMEKKYISLCDSVDVEKINDYYTKVIITCKEYGVKHIGIFDKEIMFFIDGYKFQLVG